MMNRCALPFALVLLPVSVASAAKRNAAPQAVVRQFVRAYVSGKKPVMAKTVMDPASVPKLLGPVERWLAFPPFRKAWGKQRLVEMGEPVEKDGAATVTVSFSRLNLAPLQEVSDRAGAALEALPMHQRDKKRRAFVLREIKKVTWSYETQKVEMQLVSRDGGWRIAKTGLEFGEVKSSSADVPADTEEALDDEDAPTAGGFRVNKRDLAAYPAALRVVEVRGEKLESAFAGKVIAVVHNRGNLALRGIRATVVYSGGTEAKHPNRSFVPRKPVICPGATVEVETEALAPGDRSGSNQVSLRDIKVEVDRPDAFGRMASSTECGSP